MSFIKRKSKIQIVILLMAITAWLLLAQCTMKFRTPDKRAKEDFLKKGVVLQTQTYQQDGYTMHYVQTGNDTLPTLLFVHGSPGSWDAFSKYLQDPSLLQHYRMVALDRPGFGYSSFGYARNLSGQSALIGPLLKNIKNGKPIFAVGHSLGGPLVVRLAIDYPDMFAGLVLLAPSVSPYLETAEKWRPILFKTPLNYLVPGAMRPANEELWYLKTDLKQMEPQLAAIAIPVWIIHGDKDPLVPVENIDYIKKKFVNASISIKIIPGANHFIPWEHYDEIKSVLLKLPYIAIK